MSFDNNGFYDDNSTKNWQPQPTPMEDRRRRHTGRWITAILVVAVLAMAAAGAVHLIRDVGVTINRSDTGFLLQVGSRPAESAQPSDTQTAAASESSAPAETPAAAQPSAAAQTKQDLPELQIEQSPAGAPTISSESSDVLSLQEIYRQCIGSVVSITASSQSGKSSGTGIVLSADGYLITNHHVIENAQVIAVQTSDDRQFQASIIGSDEASDLAVLKVDATDLQPAEFGDSGKLAVGDRVVAIGDPLGAQLRGTMTSGIVSAINRDLEVNDRTMTLIQTDAALNNGNSGGPLINCYGQVIGINTMKLRSYYSTTAEGLGFAIPMAVAKPILEELMENGYVAGRPAIGISYDTLPLAFRIYYNLPEGVYISAVYDGSDAQAKGVAAGDIITAVNGTRVTSIDELNRVKNQFTAGDSITLTLYNGGSYRDVAVILIDQATGQ